LTISAKAHSNMHFVINVTIAKAFWRMKVLGGTINIFATKTRRARPVMIHMA